MRSLVDTHSILHILLLELFLMSEMDIWEGSGLYGLDGIGRGEWTPAWIHRFNSLVEDLHILKYLPPISYFFTILLQRLRRTLERFTVRIIPFCETSCSRYLAGLRCLAS